MATVVVPQDMVNVIATEMASGVERAVECWMAQVEQAITDMQLTTLGRLNAVREVLEQYKHLTGKSKLQTRKMLKSDKPPANAERRHAWE